MIRTLKALSALLGYPSEELIAALPAIKAAIGGEGLVPPHLRRQLDALIDDLAARDLFDAEGCYVQLFDRTRSLSLNLFEHVHGESRDRGQAMVDLLALYRQHGLDLGSRELPDYLPLFLEFLATRPLGEARGLLGEAAHVMAALGERLEKRESPYAAVMRALEALAEGKAAVTAPLADLDAIDENDFEALDRAWMDEPVTFGPDGGGDCPRVQSVLRAMDVAPGSTDGASRRGEGV